MIKKLVAIDFDKTLMQTFEPEEGKEIWSDAKGVEYPHVGWWSKPESLDMEVFDIKPFTNVLSLLRREVNNKETYVIILTSRQEKLRPEVQVVLDANHIVVDKLDMKTSEKTKGEKILEYIHEFPELRQIDVFDDRESDILGYKEIREQIPEHIRFRIFQANNGTLRIVESVNRLDNIIREEIQKLIKN
jgi:hypothetical protein